MGQGSTQWWETWKPEIDSFIQEEMDQPVKMVVDEIFNVKSTNRLQVSEITTSGYSPAHLVGEDGDAVENQIMQNYRTNYIRGNFRDFAVFTKVLLDTDQNGDIEQKARDLPRMQSYSRELYIMGLIRNCFVNSGNFAGGDGKALVSGGHPLKNGSGTFANTYTDGVQRPLTYDNFNLLRNVMRSFVSNNGNILNMADPQTEIALVVGPYLEEQAFQIMEVETRPDTANRAGNFVAQGLKGKVIVSNMLSWEAASQAGDYTGTKASAGNFYDTQWGIVDLKASKRYAKVFSQEGYPYYKDSIRDENESVRKYAYDAYAFGSTAPFWLAFSKGDSSTYTG